MYSIKANIESKIKLFISSSMNTDEHLLYRAALKCFFDRIPIYSCFIIEQGASPDDIEDRYLKQLKKSDVVILILDSEIREGVKKEFDTAIRNKKRIFGYIKNCTHTTELNNFIENELKKNATTMNFNKINDLVEIYSDLYHENINLKDEIVKLQSMSR